MIVYTSPREYGTRGGKRGKMDESMFYADQLLENENAKDLIAGKIDEREFFRLEGELQVIDEEAELRRNIERMRQRGYRI